MVKTKEVQNCVLGCDLIPSFCWDGYSESFVTVWGISIIFLDGEIVEFTDLCTKKEDVLKLKHRLEGESISSDGIYDIVDDFLGEIYGLPT